MRDFSAADDRSGSIATGSSEQQFRRCPLCPESGRTLATCDAPLRVDGDAHDVISSQQPVERWQGADSCPYAGAVASRVHRSVLNTDREAAPAFQLFSFSAFHLFETTGAVTL